jgi:hypothetical protein
MKQSQSMDWALQLQSELSARIEKLRAMLTDIEPLRQELTRLESQLHGLERLIAIQAELRGLQHPVHHASATEIFAQNKLPQPSPIPQVTMTQPPRAQPVWRNQVMARLCGVAVYCWVAAVRASSVFRSAVRYGIRRLRDGSGVFR